MHQLDLRLEECSFRRLASRALPPRAPPAGHAHGHIADSHSSKDDEHPTKDDEHPAKDERGGVCRVFRKSDLLTEKVVKSHKIGRVLSWRSLGSFWLGEARKQNASTDDLREDFQSEHGDTSCDTEEDSEWEDNMRSAPR